MSNHEWTEGEMLAVFHAYQTRPPGAAQIPVDAMRRLAESLSLRVNQITGEVGHIQTWDRHATAGGLSLSKGRGALYDRHVDDEAARVARLRELGAPIVRGS